MKSQHRHDLETNELAKWLTSKIDEVKPYSTPVLGVVIAVLVVLFGWSWLSGSSEARQQAAWAMYNQAVETPVPNLEGLRLAAEENPGTAVQLLADIAWADGQVYRASQLYIISRTEVDKALTGAESTYQSLLRSTKDQRLLGRVHLGLGRLYELRNELDKAREQYGAVEGDFAELAQQRVKELEKGQVQETCDWLAAAQPPRATPSTGLGTPGQRPDFSAPDMTLPSGTTEGTRPTSDSLGPGDEEFFGSSSSDASAEPAAEQPAADAGANDAPAEGNDQPQ